ncbi:glycosyltransferase family 2 protein [Geodermatophilus normandii]|uniref:glycosyltransferase family 2 protein n=1 Tax=Geodermatophilus normandii TaxID=1137989 RepID=UPI001472967C|nr:cellulose synthase catalytic subunit [Geodermatophilus normandii]
MPLLILPTPPTEEEKYWYLGHQNRWFLWAAVAAGVLVLASLVEFALSHPVTWIFLALVVLRVVTTAVGLGTSSRRRRVTYSSHVEKVGNWQPDVYPSVDVFLPSAGEDVQVLANTYWHVARMEWPGRLVVHVLDDSGRDEVAQLAAGYGFAYHSRPDRGRMKKAGNLKYGFEHSSGDLIAVFDADFVPRREYLHDLVPYFDDPRVGIVQSPQFFDTSSGMNWLQRAAGATQELFYRFVQPSRDRADAAICVGTCALYRRAGLERSGGFAQIGHSEDVHTGVNLLKVGYVVRYVPVLVAKGLCPDNLSGFLNQQYRWCSGSMSLLADPKFHAAPLTLRQRLCFFSGFLYYISTGLFVFTVALPSLVMLWLFPYEIFVGNYRVLLPALAVTYALTPLVMRSTWRPAVLRVQMLYSFAHALAIWHTLGGRTADWVPTGAAGKGTPLAVTIRRVMTATVLSTQLAMWSGIAWNWSQLGVQRLWPMLVLAGVSIYIQVPALLPLRDSRPWGVVRRPVFPVAPAGAPAPASAHGPSLAPLSGARTAVVALVPTAAPTWDLHPAAGRAVSAAVIAPPGLHPGYVAATPPRGRSGLPAVPPPRRRSDEPQTVISRVIPPPPACSEPEAMPMAELV